MTDKITIASPNDPWTMYGIAYELLQITSPSDQSIHVDFEQFNLTQSGNYLTLYTGNTSDKKTEIARLSGAAFPNDITSYRSYMWLEIESDSSGTAQGFILTINSPTETGKQ